LRPIPPPANDPAPPLNASVVPAALFQVPPDQLKVDPVEKVVLPPKLIEPSFLRFKTVVSLKVPEPVIFSPPPSTLITADPIPTAVRSALTVKLAPLSTFSRA